MRSLTRLLLAVALPLFPAAPVLAQTSIDPSGHWEGVVEVPNTEVKIEIDQAPGTARSTPTADRCGSS
jgi:hypothetical protein